MEEHHLAQVNVGILVVPLDDPQLAGFVAQLEPVNALADATPGFVWRLQTEEGDATALRAFGDDRILVNMSVWTSVETLADFVYGGDHLAVLRRRREWFTKMRELFSALWWIPAGAIPTVAEAEERLVHLREHGPTAFAFTFRQPFPPPGGGDVATPDESWLCRA